MCMCPVFLLRTKPSDVPLYALVCEPQVNFLTWMKEVKYLILCEVIYMKFLTLAIQTESDILQEYNYRKE